MDASPRPASDAVPARPSELGQALEFMRALWAIDHQLHAASKRLSASAGITGPQRLAIRVVGRFPGIGAGRLAALLHLDPSTLTGIVKRLERARLLERRPDRSDGRRVVLFLTARGRATDAVRGGTVEAGFRRTLARLKPRMVAGALEVLEALSEELAR